MFCFFFQHLNLASNHQSYNHTLGPSSGPRRGNRLHHETNTQAMSQLSSPMTPSVEMNENRNNSSRFFRPAAGASNSDTRNTFWSSGRWPRATGGPGNANAVETPERPLLTDFPSPGVVSPMTQGHQHIYMEIPPEGGYENAQSLMSSVGTATKKGNGSGRYLSDSVQPIHLPLMPDGGPSELLTTGSTSSQSSGYGSSSANKTVYRPGISGDSSNVSRARPQTLFRLQQATTEAGDIRDSRTTDRGRGPFQRLNSNDQPDFVTLEDNDLVI